MRVLVVGAGGVGCRDRTRGCGIRGARARRGRRRRRRPRPRRQSHECARCEIRSARGSTRRMPAAITELAAPRARRRRDQRVRSAAQSFDIRSRVRRRLPLHRHGDDACRSRIPTRPYEEPGVMLGADAVRGVRSLEGAGSAGTGGHGRRARPLRRVRPLRGRPPLLRDRRGRRARRQRSRHRRVRLRADVLGLDDDRGVPQPAARSGSATAVGSRPRRSRSRRPSCSRRASDRSSA